jgi:hypothetical protein
MMPSWTDPAALAAWQRLPVETRRRVLVAVHESGHACAATLLGGRIAKAVVLDPPEGNATGKTVYQELPAQVAAPSTFAGPWAEARFLAGTRPTARQVEAVLASRAVCDRDELLAGAGTAFVATTVPPLLEQVWSAVIEVARVINRSGEASHHDVCSALKLDADPATAAHQLALIRGGAELGVTVTRPVAI